MIMHDINQQDHARPMMDADWNVLIRRLEYQKAALELEARFEKNLRVFRNAAPDIYERFKDYDPRELKMVLEDDGTINLANTASNDRVYPTDPLAFCQKQVMDYLRRPAVTNIDFTESTPVNDRYIYPPVYNALVRGYEELEIENAIHTEAPVGLMLVTGCGLGYHVTELLHSLDIRNMCIVDPHEDSFYASLHTLDWEEVRGYFSDRGRLFKLYVGKDQANVEAITGPLVNKIGLHNAVHTFVYRHFNSRSENEFIRSYIRHFHLAAQGAGFFDDERVSMAHTFANLESGINIFHPGTGMPERLPPAFIVGNGPSLDDLIPLLRREGDKAVIFSAGTTLGSLYKAGIKPDFHVEMERLAWVKDWIAAGTDAEYRKGIIGLGLNTLHPEALNLFDRSGVAMKGNDLGARVIKDLLPALKHQPELPFCNPTVTNCALSYALAMGFQEIYLIGVDLATSDDGRHHSRNSVYQDLEALDDEGVYVSYKDEKLSYHIPGNFAPSVSTNSILDKARVNIEILLDHFSPAAFNPNDGAKIAGAETVLWQDIVLAPPACDKQTLVNSLFDASFRHYRVPSPVLHGKGRRIAQSFGRLGSRLKLARDPGSAAAAAGELSRVYGLVQQLEAGDPYSMLLLRGSCNVLFTQIYKAVIFARRRETFLAAWRTGREIWHEFLDNACGVMRETPYAWDDSRTEKLALLPPREKLRRNAAGVH